MTRNATARTDWKDAYRALCRDIDSGALQPGCDLPTISDLAAQAGLSSYAARRVMERLREDGRAQSWQGKGFRVAMPVVRLRITQKAPVFGDAVRALGFSAESTLVASKTVGVPSEIARRMRTRTGTRARFTETLRKVNARTVAVSMDYFPHNRLANIDSTLSSTGSVSRSLAQHGIADYRRDFTELSCRPPTAHEGVLLNIPPTQPVYVTVGANLDPQGEIIQVSKAVWRADCVAYEF